MAPSPGGSRPTDPDGLVLEAWGQGLLVGALIVMASITVANMKRHVLLHKLILLELVIAMPCGTWIFPHPPVYGWYLSVTSIGIIFSWSLHNVIAWMKCRPFMSRTLSLIYMGTLILVQPYWVVEIYANFAYFNNKNNIFLITRPLEPVFRDPWWVFTTFYLLYIIQSHYDFGIVKLVKTCPRFGIVLVSLFLSICFTALDIWSVVRPFLPGLPVGAEPFWKLSLIFKCLCDTIILDDFRTALDQIRARWLQETGCRLSLDNGTANGNSVSHVEDVEAAASGSQDSSWVPKLFTKGRGK